MEYQIEYSGYIYVKALVTAEANSFEEALGKAPPSDEVRDDKTLIWMSSSCREIDVEGVDIYELEPDVIVDTESGEYKVIEGGDIVG